MRRDYDYDDDAPYIVIEREGGGGDGLGPFLWGALLGVSAALLLAPRSGAETQDEIRRAALRLRDTAEDRIDAARMRVGEVIERGRGRLDNTVTSVRDEIGTRAAQARDAVRAGRAAARQAKFELERRVDEAKTAYHAGITAARRPVASEPAEVDVVITEVVVEADPADLL